MQSTTFSYLNPMIGKILGYFKSSGAIEHPKIKSLIQSTEIINQKIGQISNNKKILPR